MTEHDETLFVTLTYGLADRSLNRAVDGDYLNKSFKELLLHMVKSPTSFTGDKYDKEDLDIAQTIFKEYELYNAGDGTFELSYIPSRNSNSAILVDDLSSLVGQSKDIIHERNSILSEDDSYREIQLLCDRVGRLGMNEEIYNQDYDNLVKRLTPMRSY